MGELFQPIETAPKDGRQVLLHGVTVPPCCELGPTTVMAYWTDHNQGGWVWHGALASRFTQWAPVPKGPHDTQTHEEASE